MTEESTNPTGGRPRTFSRADAIDRAMNLFWRKGYLPVTTRDLATAMNVQRSSFYNTFRTREAVFLEALERYANRAPDAVLDSIGLDDDVMPVVIAMMRELCRVRAEDEDGKGCLVCNSVAELVGVDQNLGAVLADAVEQQTALMARLFRQATNRGEIRLRSNVDGTARSFVAFLLGLNVASKSIRSEQQLWSACESFLIGIGMDAASLAAS